MRKRKNNKRGFTLIELIVVIVILAILAAAAIPSMIGFIDQAKGAQYISEAHTVYLAAQSVCTKHFYNDNSTDLLVIQGLTAPEKELKAMLKGSISDKGDESSSKTIFYEVEHIGPTVTKVTYLVIWTSPGKTYEVVITPGKDAVLTIT